MSIDESKIARLPNPIDGVEFVISLEFAEELMQEIKPLKAENVALRAVVDAYEAFGDIDGEESAATIAAMGKKLSDARTTLRNFERDHA